MSVELIAEYRKNADDCQVMAAKARSMDNKARWLMLAGQWLEMADKLEASGLPLSGATIELVKEDDATRP